MATPPVAAWEQPGSAAYAEFFRAAPVALLVIRADGLVMVDANQPYLDQAQLPLSELVGRHVFDVFPESPDNDEDQTGALERLMRSAIAERRPTSVQGLRYDIPVGDGFEVHWWNATEVPVLAGDGSVEFLLHYSEDVTEIHRARDALGQAERAHVRAAQLATAQAELATALTTAQSVSDLQRLASASLSKELGADTATIVSRADDGGWLVSLGDDVGTDFRTKYTLLPFDSDLPSVTTARRGTPVLIPDLESGLRLSSTIAEVHALTGRQAWAALPLTVDSRRMGSLSVSWTDPHTPSTDELELLEAVAAQCALALDRIEQTQAQRAAARQVQVLAESLQNAMLLEPPELPGLDIEVRYRSATDVAKVGGDWYDAFVQPDGAVMITIGDVCGHDHVAAGKMGQLSGLLRALAYDNTDQPHGVDPVATLLRFEQVSRALGIDELATVVLARIEPGDEGHVVRWSNAGSPPPVLVQADATVTMLDDKPDLMLGVEVDAERSEHVVRLPPGATMLLYTDGLIERRDTSIVDGIDELASIMGELSDVDLPDLCDHVLDRLSPHIGEDDVALLAVRSQPRRLP